jgi:hypothetical protein
LDINLCAVSRQSKRKHDVTPPRRRSLARRQGPRQDWNSDQRHANTYCMIALPRPRPTVQPQALRPSQDSLNHRISFVFPSQAIFKRAGPVRPGGNAYPDLATHLCGHRTITRHSLPTSTQISILICRCYGYMEYCNSSIARP